MEDYPEHIPSIEEQSAYTWARDTNILQDNPWDTHIPMTNNDTFMLNILQARHKLTPQQAVKLLLAVKNDTMNFPDLIFLPGSVENVAADGASRLEKYGLRPAIATAKFIGSMLFYGGKGAAGLFGHMPAPSTENFNHD